MTNPNSHPSQQPPLPNTHTVNKKAIVIAGVIIPLAVALGVYAWTQQAQKNNTQDVISRNDTELQKTDNTRTITADLPNGKTITYANTGANKNISWSSSSKGADYIDLSYKAIGEYLATVDQSIVTKLCGTNGELARTNDMVGTMSTTARVIEYPTDKSCLETLATLRNTDPTSRAKAVEVSKQVSADVKQFYMTAIIK